MLATFTNYKTETKEGGEFFVCQVTATHRATGRTAYARPRCPKITWLAMTEADRDAWLFKKVDAKFMRLLEYIPA